MKEVELRSLKICVHSRPLYISILSSYYACLNNLHMTHMHVGVRRLLHGNFLGLWILWIHAHMFDRWLHTCCTDWWFVDASIIAVHIEWIFIEWLLFRWLLLRPKIRYQTLCFRNHNICSIFIKFSRASPLQQPWSQSLTKIRRPWRLRRLSANHCSITNAIHIVLFVLQSIL